MKIKQVANISILKNKGQQYLDTMGVDDEKLMEIIADGTKSTTRELPDIGVDQIASIAFDYGRELEGDLHNEKHRENDKIKLALVVESAELVEAERKKGNTKGFIGTAIGALVTVIGVLGWELSIVLGKEIWQYLFQT